MAHKLSEIYGANMQSIIEHGIYAPRPTRKSRRLTNRSDCTPIKLDPKNPRISASPEITCTDPEIRDAMRRIAARKLSQRF